MYTCPFTTVIIVVVSSSQIEGQAKERLRDQQWGGLAFVFSLFLCWNEEEGEEEEERERRRSCQPLSVYVQATNMSVNERQQRKFIVLTTDVDACQTC